MQPVSRKEILIAMYTAALSAVDPYRAVTRVLSIQNSDVLAYDGVSECRAPLRDNSRVIVTGCGKAGTPMAQAVEDILGDRIRGGIVTVKHGHVGARRPRHIRIDEAGHPTPDAAGVASCVAVREILSQADEHDVLVACISGGGSSLWAAPAPGITLEEKSVLTHLLLGCGASIDEINTVRKHCSAIKGGHAARAAWPATVIALVLSDVIGDDLSVIASGPFYPDSSTFADAWRIVEKYHLVSALPATIDVHLHSGVAGKVLETPKFGDAIFDRTHHVFCGSNRQALAATAEVARRKNLMVHVESQPLSGEASAQAEKFVDRLRALQHANPGRACCLVAGGETTVTLAAGHGLGGRNQEFALAAAHAIKVDEAMTIAAIGTDGTDGPTDAAGAFADNTTCERAGQAGLDSHRHLLTHDAYPFFTALGDTIVTGPTHTNVMDLYMGIAAPLCL